MSEIPEVYKGYVSLDGNYGVDWVILFDEKQLSKKQWSNLSDLPDTIRLYYVKAILMNDKDEIEAIEADYDL